MCRNGTNVAADKRVTPSRNLTISVTGHTSTAVPVSLSLALSSAITDDYRQPRLRFLASKPDKRGRRLTLSLLYSFQQRH